MGLLAIVVAAGNDDHLRGRYTVDQPVFVVDPARPITAQIGFERFGLANAFEGGTYDVLD